MSKRLEDFIKMNRDEFDDLEPSADLWARIEMHLPPQHTELKTRQAKTFSLGFVLRVAATVIVVMGVFFVLYVRNEKRGVDLAAINPVYAKQQVQYTSQIETKRSELKSIAKTNPQLYKEFNAEIAEMDSTYKEMNNDLATSPNQERVLRAMIRNLEIQTQVLSQQLKIIEQMNNTKKEEQNDVKSDVKNI
jgi:septal ring factor EnvC (AmiA/AmiB activator)